MDTWNDATVRKYAAVLLLLLCTARTVSANPLSAPQGSERPRVIVLTDIGNEPDDSMSMVRFLLYSNDYDVDGLVATTSTWLKDKTMPQLIEERVRAYGKVLPNLRVHADGYPDAEKLLSRIRSGRPEYGMAGVGKGKDSEGSRLIIAAVDSPDPRPVWVTIWGGANTLAQALWTVRNTRSPGAVDKFLGKLRVYSISDQDDAGPWARAEFPKLWWIVSVHAFNAYSLSTWIGIGSPVPAVASEMARQPWLDANVRKGPLGELYPAIMYGMEGDTPSFLNLIATGLASPDRPDWGGWGGRYGRLTDDLGLWADLVDSAVGTDGKLVQSNQATIWRWRSAFQNDLAGRINWTMAPGFAGANHNPNLVLNGVVGRAPLMVEVCTNQPLHLSAAGSADPDGDTVKYHWWEYSDVGGGTGQGLAHIDGADSTEAVVVIPKGQTNPLVPSRVRTVHIILEATDSGSPPLTSYRRVVISVPKSSGKEVAKGPGQVVCTE